MPSWEELFNELTGEAPGGEPLPPFYPPPEDIRYDLAPSDFMTDAGFSYNAPAMPEDFVPKYSGAYEYEDRTRAVPQEYPTYQMPGSRGGLEIRPPELPSEARQVIEPIQRGIGREQQFLRNTYEQLLGRAQQGDLLGAAGDIATLPLRGLAEVAAPTAGEALEVATRPAQYVEERLAEKTLSQEAVTAEAEETAKKLSTVLGYEVKPEQIELKREKILSALADLSPDERKIAIQELSKIGYSPQENQLQALQDSKTMGWKDAIEKNADPWKEFGGKSIFDPLWLVPAGPMAKIFEPVNIVGKGVWNLGKKAVGGVVGRTTKLLTGTDLVAQAAKAKNVIKLGDASKSAFGEFFASKSPNEDWVAKLGRAMQGDFDPTISDAAIDTLKGVLGTIKADLFKGGTVKNEGKAILQRVLKKYNPEGIAFADASADQIASALQKAAVNAYRRAAGLAPIDTAEPIIARSINWMGQTLKEDWLANPGFATAYAITNPLSDFLRSLVVGRHINPLNFNAGTTLDAYVRGLGRTVPREVSRTLYGSLIRGAERAGEKGFEGGLSKVPAPLVGKPYEFSNFLKNVTGIDLGRGAARNIFSKAELSDNPLTKFARGFNLGTSREKYGAFIQQTEVNSRETHLLGTYQTEMPKARNQVASVLESAETGAWKDELASKMRSFDIQSPTDLQNWWRERSVPATTPRIWDYRPTQSVSDAGTSFLTDLRDTLKGLKAPLRDEVEATFTRARGKADDLISQWKNSIKEVTVKGNHQAAAEAVVNSLDDPNLLTRLEEQLGEIRKNYGDITDGEIRRMEAVLVPAPKKAEPEQWIMGLGDYLRDERKMFLRSEGLPESEWENISLWGNQLKSSYAAWLRGSLEDAGKKVPGVREVAGEWVTRHQDVAEQIWEKLVAGKYSGKIANTRVQQILGLDRDIWEATGGARGLDLTKFGGAKPILGYHGTTAEFTEFNTAIDVAKQVTPDRMLGTHFAVDPTVTDAFTMGAYAKEGQQGGRVIPTNLNIKNPREIPQPVYTSGARMSDQAAIGADIARVVFPERRDLFVRWIMGSRAVDEKVANTVYDLVKAGKGIPESLGRATVALDDKFVRSLGQKMDFGSYMYNFDAQMVTMKDADRAAMVQAYRDILKKQGHDSVKYINTSPNEVKAGADPTSYIVWDKELIKPKFAPRAQTLPDPTDGVDYQAQQMLEKINSILDEWQSQAFEKLGQPLEGKLNISKSTIDKYSKMLANEYASVEKKALELLENDLFDYGMRGGAERMLGFVSPFYKYQTSIVPWAIKAFEQHPALPATAKMYEAASEQDIKQKGLPPRFKGSMPIDRGISDTLAKAWNAGPGRLLGETPVGEEYRVKPQNLLAAMWGVNPFEPTGFGYKVVSEGGKGVVKYANGDVAQTFPDVATANEWVKNKEKGFTEETPQYVKTLRDIVDAGQALGMRPWPYIQAGLYKLGVYGEQYPGDILKETPAIRLLTGVDIEKGLKEWQANGVENGVINFYASLDLAEKVQSGVMTKDQALRAMADPTSKEWQQAVAAAQRSADTRTMIRDIIPMTLRAVDIEEMKLRQEQEALGIHFDVLEQARKDQDLTRIIEAKKAITEFYDAHPAMEVYGARNKTPVETEQSRQTGVVAEGRDAAWEILQQGLTKAQAEYPVGSTLRDTSQNAVWEEYRKTTQALEAQNPLANFTSSSATEVEREAARQRNILKAVVGTEPHWNKDKYKDYADFEKQHEDWEKNPQKYAKQVAWKLGTKPGQQDVSFVTPEALLNYHKQNDSIDQAIDTVYFEKYYLPFNDGFYNIVDKYKDKDFTYHQRAYELARYQAINKAPDPQKFAEMVMKEYPGRFSLKDILSVVPQLLAVEQRQAEKQKPMDKIGNEIYDLAGYRPPGSKNTTAFKQAMGNDQAVLDKFYKSKDKAKDFTETQLTQLRDAIKRATERLRYEKPNLEELARRAQAEIEMGVYQDIEDKAKKRSYWDEHPIMQYYYGSDTPFTPTFRPGTGGGSWEDLFKRIAPLPTPTPRSSLRYPTFRYGA